MSRETHPKETIIRRLAWGGWRPGFQDSGIFPNPGIWKTVAPSRNTTPIKTACDVDRPLHPLLIRSQAIAKYRPTESVPIILAPANLRRGLARLIGSIRNSRGKITASPHRY